MSELRTTSHGLRTGITLLGTFLVALVAVPIVTSPGATAKTPGKTYCFNRVCHRVLTLGETRRAVGKRKSLIASYYSHCKIDRYNPCGLTSSGARFRPKRADNAASPIYPNGTKLLVWNPANKRAAIIRIDNAGPYWRNRTLDLSSAAAHKLGFRHRGVARLVVQVISAPTRRQARYRRFRTYAPVKGYLGRFKSIASAAHSTNSPVAKPFKPARRTKTRQLANVVLPVKNVHRAERRIWLARLVETGPISVALNVRPKIRLPIRTVRRQLASLPKTVRSKRRKLAALAIKPSRKLQQKKKDARKASKPRKKTTASGNRKPRPASQPRKNAKAVTPVNKQAAKSPANVKKAPTASANPVASSPAAKPQAAQPAAPSRPKMVWRHGILGINKNGG